MYNGLCIPWGFRLLNQKFLMWRFTSAQTQVKSGLICLLTRSVLKEQIRAKGLSLVCQKHKLILYVTFPLTYLVSKWTQNWGNVQRSAVEISEGMTMGRFMDSIISYGKERMKGCKSKGIKQRIPYYLLYRYFDLWLLPCSCHLSKLPGSQATSI